VSDGGCMMTTVLDLRNAFCKRTTIFSEQQCFKCIGRLPNLRMAPYDLL
jgi:hypothetical protein